MGEKEFTLSPPNSKSPQIFPTHHQPFRGCPESLDGMGTMDSFQYLFYQTLPERPWEGLLVSKNFNILIYIIEVMMPMS